MSMGHVVCSSLKSEAGRKLFCSNLEPGQARCAVVGGAAREVRAPPPPPPSLPPAQQEFGASLRSWSLASCSCALSAQRKSEQAGYFRPCAVCRQLPFPMHAGHAGWLRPQVMGLFMMMPIALIFLPSWKEKSMGRQEDRDGETGRQERFLTLIRQTYSIAGSAV